MERDCTVCPDRIECVVCKRKLCHIHEPEPKLVKMIEGHYITREGTICMECEANQMRPRRSQ